MAFCCSNKRAAAAVCTYKFTIDMIIGFTAKVDFPFVIISPCNYPDRFSQLLRREAAVTTLY